MEQHIPHKPVSYTHLDVYKRQGIVTTLEVTFLALILGVVIGVVIAVIRSAHDSQRGSKKGIGHVILAFFNAIAKLYLTAVSYTHLMLTNGSMTTVPSYSISRRAFPISLQGVRPFPGTIRLHSPVWK